MTTKTNNLSTEQRIVRETAATARVILSSRNVTREMALRVASKLAVNDGELRKGEITPSEHRSTAKAIIELLRTSEERQSA